MRFCLWKLDIGWELKVDAVTNVFKPKAHHCQLPKSFGSGHLQHGALSQPQYAGTPESSQDRQALCITPEITSHGWWHHVEQSQTLLSAVDDYRERGLRSTWMAGWRCEMCKDSFRAFQPIDWCIRNRPTSNFTILMRLEFWSSKLLRPVWPASVKFLITTCAYVIYQDIKLNNAWR